MIKDLSYPPLLRRWARRWLTSAGNKINFAVTAGALNQTISWDRAEGDANYGVIASTSWSTTVYISAKTTTGFNINFGTAPPVGATVDIITFRSE